MKAPRSGARGRSNRFEPLFARVFVLLCAAWLCAVARAGDWPMWRYDAKRSAATREKLPAKLHLRWTRKLAPIRAAWPFHVRERFDASYEPVVGGKTVFIASPNDDSVTAFDTETGKEKWKFYANGPVRFAPVILKGKVYFGSDDGYLYCLDAADGKLAWKYRGAPKDRPEYWHLGNGRLVSFWPVRGAPVEANGRIYFAAGIWPILGIFIHAVDAETGKRVWINRRSHLIENVRIDHNLLRDMGLAPQGYLAVTGNKLIVPNGCSMPAGFDCKNGRLLWYVQGYRNGFWKVTATSKYLFVGPQAVLNVSNGREVGSRWAQAGSKAPNGFDTRNWDLFEGPFFPYRFSRDCTADSAVSGNKAYSLLDGVFYCHDLARARLKTYEKPWSGRKFHPLRWDARELWRFSAAKGRGTLLIKAGNRLYGHADKTLLALEIPTGRRKPRVSWQTVVDGHPSSMLAADGKLFVVTKEGAIHCYGGRPAKTRVYEPRKKTLPKPPAKWARAAGDILKATGAEEGYCVALGAGSGGLIKALLAQSQLRIICVEKDAEKVDKLRRTFVGAGLYGTRVALIEGDPCEFRFPPFLANLVVSETLDASAVAARLDAKTLLAVLRPYGGAACLAASEDAREAFDGWATKVKLENAQVQHQNGFALLRRTGPLPGASEWTHETGDAARSFFSRDKRVKPPFAILWYGDGEDHGFYTPRGYDIGVKPQVTGGRLFAFQRGSYNLFALDVYTGRHLWKRRVGKLVRYASLGDGVYVADGDRLTVLDAASGKKRKTFNYGARGRGYTARDIRVAGDVVLVAVSLHKERAIQSGLWDSKILIALDRKTGRVLWRREARKRFNNNALVLAAGKAFCVDSVSPVKVYRSKRRGETDATPSLVMALDARTGKPLWSKSVVKTAYFSFGNWLGHRANDDWLAYSVEHGTLLWGKGGDVTAFKGDTGEQLWREKVKGGQPVILRGKTFITQKGVTYDLSTGKLINDKELFKPGGCNYGLASEYVLFSRYQSAAFVDLTDRKRYLLRNIRSGCSNSYVPADGVVSVPNFSAGCICNYPVQGSFTLIHMSEAGEWDSGRPLKAAIPSKPLVRRR